MSQAQQLGLTRPGTLQQLSGGTTVNVLPSENNRALQMQLDALTERTRPTFQRYDFDSEDEDKLDVLSRADTNTNANMFSFLDEAIAASGIPKDQQKEVKENVEALYNISAAAGQGTKQGLRAVEPSGQYKDYREFIESYNKGLATRWRTPVGDRINYISLKGKKLVPEPIEEAGACDKITRTEAQEQTPKKKVNFLDDNFDMGTLTTSGITPNKLKLYAEGFDFYQIQKGNIKDHPNKDNPDFKRGYEDSKSVDADSDDGPAARGPVRKREARKR